MTAKEAVSAIIPMRKKLMERAQKMQELVTRLKLEGKGPWRKDKDGRPICETVDRR